MSQTKAELLEPKADFTISGTTPTLTIGDAGAEDTKIVFDGNAVDYYLGLDDSADNLIIGSGSTVGSNSLITMDSDGDVTLDATSDIILDSDAANWRFKDGGTSILEIGNPSGPSFYSAVSDADIIFKGNDGGSAITAWTMDMSDGGHLLPGNAATGIYLGVNSATAANLLHDYEEGTWTPHLEGNTNDEVDNYDSRSGVYTKVGRLVTLHCYIDAGTKGTVNGDYMRVGNFPFTPEDTNSITFAAASIGYWMNFDIDDAQLMATTYGSNAFAYLFKTSTDNGFAQVTTGNLDDNARIAMTATYTVAT